MTPVEETFRQVFDALYSNQNLRPSLLTVARQVKTARSLETVLIASEVDPYAASVLNQFAKDTEAEFNLGDHWYVHAKFQELLCTELKGQNLMRL